jgi:hypothetical protein
MDKVLSVMIKEFDFIARPCESEKDIAQIATIVLN